MNIIEQTQGMETLSKSKVKEMANSLIADAESGNVDILSTLAHIEFMSQVIEEAKTNLRNMAVGELEKYGLEAKTGVVKHGVTFKQKEVAVKYSFYNTHLWKEMKDEEDIISERRKNLEEQLKLLKTMIMTVDPSTGELTELHPPSKSSKTSIEISLAK